jgi:hypothetical protein
VRPWGTPRTASTVCGGTGEGGADPASPWPNPPPHPRPDLRRAAARATVEVAVTSGGVQEQRRHSSGARPSGDGLCAGCHSAAPRNPRWAVWRHGGAALPPAWQQGGAAPIGPVAQCATPRRRLLHWRLRRVAGEARRPLVVASGDNVLSVGQRRGHGASTTGVVVRRQRGSSDSSSCNGDAGLPQRAAVAGLLTLGESPHKMFWWNGGGAFRCRSDPLLRAPFSSDNPATLGL